MSIKYDKYMPLYAYLSPASIPQIVAHIQDYLVKHPILSAETIAEIIVESLQEHPELINGTAIPISADSEQSIKAYIDSLPSIDTYTKAEINTLLTGKQDTLTFDQAPTPGSSNPVTSSGIIAAMSAMNEALETLINSKADSATTYTKTQVDTLLTDKANADDVYSKNTMDAKLLEYATSESVYSKQDINTMKQVNKANLAIVSTDGLAPLDIAAGQYVYFNDVMYMATEEILTGAQLVPNANIVINPIGVTNRIGDGLKNAVTQINGLADRMTLAEEGLNSQSQQIDKKADIPVIVSVVADTAGASMSAADLEKLTSDMIMLWYSGDSTKVTENIEINPGSGQQPTGRASSSTTFTIAFIHSANTTAVTSVIPKNNIYCTREFRSVVVEDSVNGFVRIDFNLPFPQSVTITVNSLNRIGVAGDHKDSFRLFNDSASGTFELYCLTSSTPIPIGSGVIVNVTIS